MSNQYPTAKSAQTPDEREKLKRLIAERGLCGLANDTKWDEFISAVRERTDWRPSYRYKSVACAPSGWDVEWFYHLPFPCICVEWFDVAYWQETRKHWLPRIDVTDHSQWFAELLQRIGLEYQKGKEMIRIFGYSPKSLELFDDCATVDNAG